MQNMKYFFVLSLKYIRKNRARAVYSVIGIMLTYILCFSVFTVGYSWWDYGLEEEYYATGSYHPAQLYLFLTGEEISVVDLGVERGDHLLHAGKHLFVDGEVVVFGVIRIRRLNGFFLNEFPGLFRT